jgi:hypothetical protein
MLVRFRLQPLRFADTSVRTVISSQGLMPIAKEQVSFRRQLGSRPALTTHTSTRAERTSADNHSRESSRAASRSFETFTLAAMMTPPAAGRGDPVCPLRAETVWKECPLMR